jgi:hypothetical protein
MKSLSVVLALLRFNLRMLPWRIWLIVALATLWQLWLGKAIGVNDWLVSGGRTTGLGTMWILYCAFIASLFFEVRDGSGGGLIPYGEFILIRPILRRTAYFTSIPLYFILILVAPLAAVIAGSPHPDLRINFYVGTAPDVSAEQIKFYQNQFPDSAVVHDNPRFQVGGYDKTLVIPSGALLIARWDVFVALGIALILQMRMLFRSPSKNMFGSFFGILFGTYFLAWLVLIMMFPPLRPPLGPTPYEYAFFFFARYPALSWVLALEAFLFVQSMALKRIKGFEVI